MSLFSNSLLSRMIDVLLLFLSLSLCSLSFSLGLVKQNKPVPPHRASISDGNTTPGRKAGVAGSGSTHGSESNEELIISVNVTPSPDSQSDTGKDHKCLIHVLDLRTLDMWEYKGK